MRKTVTIREIYQACTKVICKNESEAMIHLTSEAQKELDDICKHAHRNFSFDRINISPKGRVEFLKENKNGRLRPTVIWENMSNFDAKPILKRVGHLNFVFCEPEITEVTLSRIRKLYIDYTNEWKCECIQVEGDDEKKQHFRIKMRIPYEKKLITFCGVFSNYNGLFGGEFFWFNKKFEDLENERISVSQICMEPYKYLYGDKEINESESEKFQYILSREVEIEKIPQWIIQQLNLMQE